jgi:hypothetical protein
VREVIKLEDTLAANAQTCMNNAATLEQAARNMARLPDALEAQTAVLQTAALLHIAAALNISAVLAVREAAK